jgi:acetyl esterase
VADQPEHDLADDGLAAWVAQVRAGPLVSARDSDAARLRADSAARVASRPRGPELTSVADITINGDPALSARLYRPGPDPLPLLVFFHGGGWTFGNLDSHDGTCRKLAQQSHVAVLAVDYRLAPEHTWPAAVDDALAAYRWARLNVATLVGTDVIGVAGDSSGGNLAALCCLRLRDAGQPQPRVQVLIYPNTDLTFSHPSVVEKATGWGLEADDALWFADQWVPDPVTRANPRVSPLAEPHLTGLAPAIVVTAEHDPLRDEGNAYAEALAAAGVPVVHRVESGHVHGFLGLDSVSPAAGEALARLAADIAHALTEHR